MGTESMQATVVMFSSSVLSAALTLLAGLITVSCADLHHRSPDDAVITSGAIWNDTEGNPVHAHGAGLVLPEAHPAGAGGKYFMVGTSQKHNPGWLSEGINMYSSYDLQHWHFEAMIFKNTSITTPLSDGTQYRIERPKVIYNAKMKKFVMYFHL